MLKEYINELKKCNRNESDGIYLWLRKYKNDICYVKISELEKDAVFDDYKKLGVVVGYDLKVIVFEPDRFSLFFEKKNISKNKLYTKTSSNLNENNSFEEDRVMSFYYKLKEKKILKRKIKFNCE
ncbi:hypothetical protein [Aureivirga sp. CE67]|uniref:hypothetical protein n=1 Tax=Aureivirga sp. CE67 TaxID=1788983 RepID=UPI0018CB803E|nr:hypothetical protein [Aureivirga sp. CE67]